MVSPKQLDDDVMEALGLLHEQAARMRIPFAEYLRSLATGVRHPRGEMSVEEMDRLLDELAVDDDPPVLPPDFSRGDIYMGS
ncbi:MAG: hypothetical protein WD768_01525 [Phycisphaeraceae bacterium]